MIFINRFLFVVCLPFVISFLKAQNLPLAGINHMDSLFQGITAFELNSSRMMHVRFDKVKNDDTDNTTAANIDIAAKWGWTLKLRLFASLYFSSGRRISIEHLLLSSTIVTLLGFGTRLTEY